MLQTKVVEKIQTHFKFIKFFQKPCHLWDNLEKYCTARQTTDDSV